MLRRLIVGGKRLNPSARYYSVSVQQEIASDYDATKSGRVFPRAVIGARIHNVKFYQRLSSAVPPTEKQWTRWAPLVAKNRINWKDELEDETVPIWLLVHLVACKVHSPEEAVEAAKYILKFIPPRSNPIPKLGLLIQATRTLARYQASILMPDIVNEFIEIPVENAEHYYNYLLVSISHFKMTPELGKLIVRILEVMHGRQITLWSRTYRIFLSNPIITLELAKFLQRREPTLALPTVHDMEAYLRVFAKSGAVHASARFLNLIRKTKLKEGEMAPHGVELSKGASVPLDGIGVAMHYNAKFLSSFNRHSGSAFNYLRSLLAVEKRPNALNAIHAPKKLMRFQSNPGKRVYYNNSIDLSYWTTVLRVVVRDENVNHEKLLELFSRIRSTTGMRVTIAVITVVMHGLVKKGDYATAYRLWSAWVKLSKRRHIIDRKSLTVAMTVIVRAGHPLEAWDLLIHSTNVLSSDGTSLQNRINVPGRRRRMSPVEADTTVLNAFADACFEIGRTDMVFKLWEAFTPLFGAYPDSVTLTLLLRAGREAARFDRTLRGLLEQAGIHGLFQKRKVWPDYSKKSKKEIAQSLRSIIYRGMPKDRDLQKPEVKRIRKALWNDDLAGPKVRNLFRRILFSNWPDLANLQAPAEAVWSDNARVGHPIRDALRAIGVTGIRKTLDKQEPAASTGPTADTSKAPLLLGPYLLNSPTHKPERVPTPSPRKSPQIVPDAKTFGAYIELLGGLGYGSEVAQVFVWMRELGVRPSKRTLALALALWSEVSMRGPLLEHYGTPSEYKKLYHWLVLWLGLENMPTDGMLGWAFRYWKQEREK